MVPSGTRIVWTTPRSPANEPEVVPALKPSQTPSLPAAQLVRTGSRSWKSLEPPKLTAPVLLASNELQNGLAFCAAPTGTFESVPIPLPGGLRTLTNASVVPERSLRRQAWVRPAEQVPSPAAQSVEKRFFQFLMSDFRTGLAQLYVPSWVRPKYSTAKASNEGWPE